MGFVYHTLTPKKTGGAMMPHPHPDVSLDYSARRKALATTLWDDFLSSFPHILIPNLKLICFSIIALQNVSATIIANKFHQKTTTKTKGRKNKDKKFIKQ